MTIRGIAVGCGRPPAEKADRGIGWTIGGTVERGAMSCGWATG